MNHYRLEPQDWVEVDHLSNTWESQIGNMTNQQVLAIEHENMFYPMQASYLELYM